MRYTAPKLVQKVVTDRKTDTHTNQYVEDSRPTNVSLENNKISVESTITLVRWRTRMARFKENYKVTYLNSACPHCLVQPDTQKHALECTEVSKYVTIEGRYEDIFLEDIPEGIIRTIQRITNFREDIV